MKKAPYMSSSELPQFLKVGLLCGEMAAVIPNVNDKAWKQKLKTCVTYLDGIIMERLKCLEPKSLESVKRRHEHTSILLRSTDQDRTSKAENLKVTVDEDDLFELCELALNSCIVCRENDCVEKCRFRLVMHRLGIPVANDSPESGRCEFKAVGMQKKEGK